MIAVFLRTLVSLTISGGIIAAAAATARLASRGRIPGRFMRLVWIVVVSRFLVPVFIPVSVPARALFLKMYLSSGMSTGHPLQTRPVRRKGT